MRPFVLLLLLPGALLGTSARLASAWEIKRFDADLTIGPDARLRVVEMLRVDFGPERRHTICRALPRLVTDPSGARRPLELDLIAVTDAAGRPWPIRVERSSRSLDVWMGSAERFMTGEQSYCLTYEVQGAVWAGPTRDELYWDVTGNAWDVLVIAGAVRIAWPPGADPDHIEGASRVTRFGRATREADVKIIDADRAQFLLNRGLLTFEGLSVAVVWPKGLVRHPGWVAKSAAFAARNPALAFVPAAAALLLALGARRRRAGRGLAMVAAPPGPATPPRVSPAEAGYLSSGRLEPAHVAAALCDLEGRGAFVFGRPAGADADRDVVFRRIEPGASGKARSALEDRLLALLFPEGAMASTLAAFASRARLAWPALAQDVEAALIARGDLDPRPFSRRSPVILGAVIALALGMTAGVAGRRAAHGLLGMATAPDWVAVGGGSMLLALVVAALGAWMPRVTRAGGRLSAEIKRYADALGTEPDHAGAEPAHASAELPFAIALGLEERIAGRVDASTLIAARAVKSALRDA